MPRAVGLDFGTTNSAIAVVEPDGSAQLTTFPTDDVLSTTFRSILYFFHPRDEEADGRRIVAGPGAITASREAEPRGRFIQALIGMLLPSSNTLAGITSSPWVARPRFKCCMRDGKRA